MTDTFARNFPDQETTVAVEIVPVEEDDLDTLAVVQLMRTDIQQAVSSFKNATVQSLPSEPHARSGLDIILLITLIGANIATYKDLLTNLFTIVSTTLEILAKRGQVQEIEIVADGKTFILREVSKKTAKELIDAFTAQHPEATATLTPGKSVNIKAKVSKQRKRQK
jgi:hypothetical protein